MIRFLTKVTDFITNSLLSFLLLGIISLAGLSIYSLTPQSYESTLEDSNVLGAVDNYEIEQDKSEYVFIEEEIDYSGDEFVDISKKSLKYEVRSYMGDEGYLSKVQVSNYVDEYPVELDLVRILNKYKTPKEYLVKISLENELNDSIVNVVTKNIPFKVSFDEGGIAEMPLKLGAEDSTEIGLTVNMPSSFLPSDTTGLEVEIIELGGFKELP